MKIKIIPLCLLSVLTISLFATLTAQSTQAIPPLYDVFSLKEYKQYSSYSPSYTFSKPNSNALQMMSTQNGIGSAYAFMHIPRDDLHNHKLRITWQWFLDYGNVQYTLADLYVVNNVHNRKLVNSGEFRTQNDIEHPIADYTNIQACSLTAVCNGQWISSRTDTSGVLNLNGWNPTVTIMIRSVDPWSGNTVGLRVSNLEILDASNNVVKTYDFTSKVWMEQTGGNYDYGQLRNPASTLYGTEDYTTSTTGAPAGEAALSQSVSDFIRGLYAQKSIYGYLHDYWGSGTTVGTVSATTTYTELTYDYSAVLYKGHIYPFSSGACGSNCGLAHYGVWGQYASSTKIGDFDVDFAVRSGMIFKNRDTSTHDFIFIWACGHADPSRVGTFNGGHNSGLMASWMHLNPSSLSSNGYTNPDDSDHVFIGFNWLSPSYVEPTVSNGIYNYGHWAYRFYEALLNDGLTVRQALDQATALTYGNNMNFGASPLANEIWVWNPNANNGAGGSEKSNMHIWGDGNAKVPR
ncbi:MAG: hypothetical protein LBH74_09905 [Nitrososphaerota archaeon]|nr:hypothetical protein [Nitrososphaerota archaeon]